MDSNLPGLIHHVVSSSKEFVVAFDELLKREAEAFAVDKATIQTIRVLMDTSAKLIARLYEENASIMDNLADLTKNKNVVTILNAMHKKDPKEDCEDECCQLPPMEE